MQRTIRTSERTGRGAARNRTGSKDAIALLKADHRQVEGWFSQFKKARRDDRKAALAGKICKALRVHKQVEEEIFYPAFLTATRDKDLHHEAAVEHAAAERMIAEIEGMRPGAEYFDAKVKVLSEMIRHHVKEEEKPGGMFAEARKSDLDLDDLGRRLKARKDQLESNGAGPPLAAATGNLDS